MIDLLHLCLYFSTVLIILFEWRHLHKAKHLCVHTWMDWFRLQSRCSNNFPTFHHCKLHVATAENCSFSGRSMFITGMLLKKAYMIVESRMHRYMVCCLTSQTSHIVNKAVCHTEYWLHCIQGIALLCNSHKINFIQLLPLWLLALQQLSCKCDHHKKFNSSDVLKT